MFQDLMAHYESESKNEFRKVSYIQRKEIIMHQIP
jgi:preprotein translocase subunit SecE